MSKSSDVLASIDECGLRLVDRQRVAAVIAELPESEAIVTAADLFAVLSDPNRLRLLCALLVGGEMCVCDLAAVVGMSESAASHALRWLRAHRIVAAPHRRGRMAYYQLADSHVRSLLAATLTHAQHADSAPVPGAVRV